MKFIVKIYSSVIYISWQKLDSGFDNLRIYDGGNKYSDLIKSMTGTYRNKKVSVPRNQMLVAFETTSTVAKRGFKASILENSI